MIPRIDEAKSDFDGSDNIKLTYDPIKRVKWYDHILLNRPLQIIIALIIAAIIVPVLIYNYHFIPSGQDRLSIGSCLLPVSFRLPCGPGNVAEEQCHPECCYDISSHFCFHRLPSTFSYLTNRTWSEHSILYPRVFTTPYNRNSLTGLRLSISEESSTHISFTFYDARKELILGQRLYDKSYSYEVKTPEIGLTIRGKSGLVFDTISGPLIATDDIWEIVFRLTNGTMHGLGEIPLRKGTKKILYSHENDFSTIPLIFAKYNNSYHGLLIDTNAPTEIMILHENQIVVRSLNGLGLKFHLFVGPKPRDVMRDAMTLIGSRRNFDYWNLGAHICGTSDMELSNYINNLITMRVPYESHCGKKPIVIGSNRCETKEDENIRGVQDSGDVIRRANRRFVPRISPYIRYNENSTILTPAICSILPEFELFMYHEPRTFSIYKGKVKEDDVMYPAYDVATQVFLNRMWPFTTQFDGIVVENNWPLDESNKTYHDASSFLPYYTEGFKEVQRNTPKWNITLLGNAVKYMFKHNTYGKESFDILHRLAGENIFAMTTNQWMSGSAAVYRQNIDASWSNLRKELVAAALGGISGHWLWSSPICGDTKVFDPESQTSLCIKWYLAAIFLPMITIDSTTIPRDPSAFPMAERLHMIEALNRRQSLLPYFNTVLQKGPLLRPMFYQFPEAQYLENITTQFSVGDYLLIVPNLQPFQSHVHVLMPPGTWYEFWGGARVNSSEGEMATMTTLESELLTLIYGGSIIMSQHDPQQRAEDTRLRSFFTLTIALECGSPNNTLRNCSATGNIFMLPTISFNFEATNEKLYIRAHGNDFDPVCDWRNGAIWMNDIQHIKVYGLEERYNNFDTYRLVTQWIDLCDLINDSVIVFDLV